MRHAVRGAILTSWIAGAAFAQPAPPLLALRPEPGTVRLGVEAPDLPGERFTIAPPQAIGDRSGTLVTHDEVHAEWSGPDEDGGFRLALTTDAVVYAARVIPFHDHVDLWETVTNTGSRTLEGAFTFTCVSAYSAPSFADPALERTSLVLGGKPTVLANTGRSRYTFYETAGAGAGNAFVDRHGATGAARATEGTAAIVAQNREHALGVGTRRIAFVYSNPASSCVHVAPDFGTLAPSASASALTRVYVLAGSERVALRRIGRDLHGADVVPSLRATLPRSERPRLQGLDVYPAWPDFGHVTLRFPESLGSGGETLFLDEQPGNPLAMWRVDAETGRCSYAGSAGRIEMAGTASPTASGVELGFAIKNVAKQPTGTMSAQMCLMLDTAPDVCERDLSRTWFVTPDKKWLALSRTTFAPIFARRPRWLTVPLASNGPPPPQGVEIYYARTQEAAELPLIAATSEHDRHIVGLAWEQSGRLMSNGAIPCLHSDPVFPSCAPGAQFKAKGVLYLLTGSLDDLARRYHADFASGR